MPQPERKCSSCKKLFIPKRFGQRNCSRQCGKDQFHKTSKLPPRPPREKDRP